MLSLLPEARGLKTGNIYLRSNLYRPSEPGANRKWKQVGANLLGRHREICVLKLFELFIEIDALAVFLIILLTSLISVGWTAYEILRKKIGF
jgi:hypothetical protein